MMKVNTIDVASAANLSVMTFREDGPSEHNELVFI